MIRVLLVDDHPVVRLGLGALIDLEDDLAVVAEAADVDSAVRAVEREHPDVVLMDLQLAGGDSGAEATRRIRALPEAPPVLVLTNYDTDGDILRAVEAGASGYLLKDAPPAELLAAIRAAHAGESALAPGIAGRLLDRLRSPQVTPSARELEVLALVAAGDSNAEIARRLVVSEATVKSHLVHVFAKLGVASRTAAVAAARERGLLR